jgi:hypothetical protein
MNKLYCFCWFLEGEKIISINITEGLKSSDMGEEQSDQKSL